VSDNGRIVLAVPNNGAGGLDGERSGHFGRCDCFTIVEIENGSIVNTRVVDNPPHMEGGCLRPVNLLKGEGVNALVVGGIGGRPLAGFNDVGIAVYFDTTTPQVGVVAEKVAAGEVDVIDPSFVCGGH